MTLEVEVIHIYIQTLPVAWVEVFLGILKQKSGLSNPSRTANAYHTVVPVYLIHKGAVDRCIGVLYEISMSSKESFHVVVLALVLALLHFFGAV